MSFRQKIRDSGLLDPASTSETSSQPPVSTMNADRRGEEHTEKIAVTTSTHPADEHALSRYFSTLTGKSVPDPKANTGVVTDRPTDTATGSAASPKTTDEEQSSATMTTTTEQSKTGRIDLRKGFASFTLRRMRGADIYAFGECNIDPFTETYETTFYLQYMSRYPECCWVYEFDGKIIAYILGKIESSPFPPSSEPYDPDTNTKVDYLPWHAHITALTVANAFRRGNLGTQLSAMLEKVADQENCWFIDLFVRADNENAIKLYKKLGYTVYKRVVGYYNDGEDAFDMRKPLSRDKDRKHIRENGEDHHVDPSRVW